MLGRSISSGTLCFWCSCFLGCVDFSALKFHTPQVRPQRSHCRTPLQSPPGAIGPTGLLLPVLEGPCCAFEILIVQPNSANMHAAWAVSAQVCGKPASAAKLRGDGLSTSSSCSSPSGASRAADCTRGSQDVSRWYWIKSRRRAMNDANSSSPSEGGNSRNPEGQASLRHGHSGVCASLSRRVNASIVAVHSSSLSETGARYVMRLSQL